MKVIGVLQVIAVMLFLLVVMARVGRKTEEIDIRKNADVPTPRRRLTA